MSKNKIPTRKNASFLTPFLPTIVEMKNAGFTFREITEHIAEQLPDKQVLINNVLRFYHRHKTSIEKQNGITELRNTVEINSEKKDFINILNPMEGIKNPDNINTPKTDLDARLAEILGKAPKSQQGQKLSERRQTQQRKNNK